MMKQEIFLIMMIITTIFLAGCSTSKIKTSAVNNLPTDSTFLVELLKQNTHLINPAVLNDDQYRVQVIYTRIDRDKHNQPLFTDFTFHTHSNQYYYPASTIKLPIALLALQKLNELKINDLDRNTTMITDSAFKGEEAVFNDAVIEDGRPTIANYIKQVLLVSDNEANNRLYEFLGQEYINNSLHEMGYTDVQIIHRLGINLNEDQNRVTNPVTFYDTSSKVIYSKPLLKSKLVYAHRNDFLGKGFLSNGELKMEPFDFSKKNRLALADLHSMVKSIFFPAAVAKNKQFNITKEERLFIQKYMSMLPGESISPIYNKETYPDDYVKFLFYGSEGSKPHPGIRIFNKVGDAYGFLIDGAYVVDFENNIEFLISAVIHCNSNGIYNDDQYEYKEIGLPFMKNLGQVIYQYELKRERKNKPDLSSIRFNYLQEGRD